MVKSLFRNLVVSVIRYEAKLVLVKYKPRIVVVVGSVGKTTTKDAVYSILAKRHFVRKSEKSFNSDIGVPLTILGCKNAWSHPIGWLQNILEGLFLILLKNNYPEWLVLEVGADKPGDISGIARWLQSDAVILTRLPEVPVHVEFFDSPKAVVREKASIITSLKPGGLCIGNGDDPIIRTIMKENDLGREITFGESRESTVYASHYGITSHNKKPVGIRFHLHHNKEDIPIDITGVVGRQHMLPVIAAAAFGVGVNVPLSDIVDALSVYTPPNGRMKLMNGVKNTLIIDDTYNSSPVAVLEALATLEKVHTTGRKIAVLGDMMELGKFSIEEHKRVGERASSVVAMLITVGFRARDIAEGALHMGMDESKILQYDDAREAGKELQNILEDGDVVLLKASQSIRLERVVEEIMAEPMRKGELLVRQEREWKRR